MVETFGLKKPLPTTRQASAAYTIGIDWNDNSRWPIMKNTPPIMTERR